MYVTVIYKRFPIIIIFNRHMIIHLKAVPRWTQTQPFGLMHNYSTARPTHTCKRVSLISLLTAFYYCFTSL